MVQSTVNPPIAELVLNDPLKRNALGLAMFDALEGAVSGIVVEDAWHVATALEGLLRGLGMQVVGPAATILAAERIAPKYCCPGGLSIGAQMSCRSGKSMPYFSGTLRRARNASSHT